MGDKDYYEILGLERDASPAEIKRAYRKLVKQTHPDVCDAPDSAKRFNEIDEAHDVLNDPEARRQYDHLTAPAGKSKSPADRGRLAADDSTGLEGVRGLSPADLCGEEFLRTAPYHKPGLYPIREWKIWRPLRIAHVVIFALGILLFLAITILLDQLGFTRRAIWDAIGDMFK